MLQRPCLLWLLATNDSNEVFVDSVKEHQKEHITCNIILFPVLWQTTLYLTMAPYPYHARPDLAWRGGGLTWPDDPLPEARSSLARGGGGVDDLTRWPIFP